MPALPQLQAHLLACAPCPLWSALRCLLHARKGISMYFDGSLKKKPSLLRNISNLTHSEAGGPAVFAAQEVWGSTWPSS